MNRGAYAVYHKIEVGYNDNLGLTEDVNAVFAKLNTSAKAGDTIELDVKLSKPTAGSMTFKVTPVAGDSAKTVRVKILKGCDLDQLLVFRLEPVGNTPLEAVTS